MAYWRGAGRLGSWQRGGCLTARGILSTAIAADRTLGCAAVLVKARAVEIAPAPARTGAEHDDRRLGASERSD